MFAEYAVIGKLRTCEIFNCSPEKLTKNEGGYEENMENREERYAAAEALKDEGSVEEAVTMMEGVVADHPDYSLAFSALAAWCTRLERHEDAVRHARKVVELEPNDPFSYTALSVACMRGGRIEEAEGALARSRTLQGG